jgi:hypothetical protein
MEKELPDHEKEGSDLELLDAAPDVFRTPKKKKIVKVKEQLDDAFLRRSRRVLEKLRGFKDAESASKFNEDNDEKKYKEPKSAKKSKSAKGKKQKEDASMEEEPIPLAIIPPTSMEVAPHLPREVLQGIGHGSFRFSLRLSLLLCLTKMILMISCLLLCALASILVMVP